MKKKKKKSKARIKARPVQPSTVTVTLSSNDFGQMMDGLRSRLESWSRTATYYVANSTESAGLIEECNDGEEATKIADHYRALIADLEGQSQPQAQAKRRVYSLADLESVTAVTAEFFSSRKSVTFYQNYCDSLSGMVGVWQYVRDAAIILEAEAKNFGEAGEDYDWMQTVQEFAERLYIKSNLVRQQEIAREVLTKNTY